MAKKSENNDRRRRIEEIKKQQKNTERRTTYIFVGIAVLLAAGLIASAVVFGGSDDDAALTALGTPKADAGCTDPVEADKELSGQHVGPGASDAKLAGITQVSYATTPPTGGDHYLQAAAPNKLFYDRDDVIQPERLVHNLEHGYVVVWYDKQASGDDLDTLRKISRNISEITDRRFGGGPKLIVAPYNRGDFEGDNNIGMTSWGASQMCKGVSGEAIQGFIGDYRADGPKSKAPEKAAG